MAKEPGRRFTSIRLQNWRNFREVDTDLTARVFIIGPNAAGKSNFLDAFRFLRDIVVVGGGLQEACRRRGGLAAVRCLAAHGTRMDVSVKVSIGSEHQPAEWEYEVAFNERGRRLVVKKERVMHNGKVILERPDKDDRADEARLTQTFLEQVNVNKEFREVAEFLQTVRYRHIVPQLVREPERSVGRTNDPFGGDFLEQVARVPERTRKSRLKRIEEALRVAVPQLQQLELYRDEVKGTWHLRGKYEHWRPNGAWQTEEQFSDGTLRLLGLLWSIVEQNGPLLLEEPELSLHPDVVRQIPAMIARAQRRSNIQVLLSTHSFDLLDDSGVGLDEVILLVPGRDGTQVKKPNELDEIRELIEGGVGLGEALLPLTRPKDFEQLSFFGDRL
ncbi:MAG: AAA family ATPase [Firmicutes bacterium]|nr:AAA family ATPase [Bacillota bacterium]